MSEKQPKPDAARQGDQANPDTREDIQDLTSDEAKQTKAGEATGGSVSLNYSKIEVDYTN